MSTELDLRERRATDGHAARPADLWRPAATSARPPMGDRVLQAHLVCRRRLLRDLLHAALPDLEITGASLDASSVTKAIAATEAARNRHPIIIDGADPGLRPEAEGLIASVRAAGGEILVVLCDSDPITAASWVESGATAVLTEDGSVAELRDALDRLSRGDTVLGVAVRESLLAKLRGHRQEQLEPLTPFQSLTKREAAVLHELAQGSSPEEIAKLSFVSLNTIRTQIRAVLTKLGVNSVVSAVVLAYKSGWVASSDRP